MNVTVILYAGCGALYLALTTLILLRLRLSRTGFYLALACGVSAVWAALVAFRVGHPWGGPGGLTDLLRSIVWYCFLLHLYRRTVPGRGMVLQAFIVTGLIGALVVGVGVVSGYALRSGIALWSVAIGLRLGLAVCNLLLVENLYRNAAPATKWHINLPCIALGALFVYDVVLWADAALFGQLSLAMVNARAIAAGFVVPLLAVGAARNRNWAIDIHVSRQAVFHSATLILAGVFLIGLAVTGEVLRYLGADWGAAAQVGLFFAGFVSIAVLLTSGSARSWLQRLVVSHFFSRRYDYEQEWMRSIAMLAGDDAFTPLHNRVIRVVAGIVDSPGGALYLNDSGFAAGGSVATATTPAIGESGFAWAGSWNMPAAVTAFPPTDALIVALYAGAQVIVLPDRPDLSDANPVLMDAWLAVKLPRMPQHGVAGAADAGMIGFILVKPSRTSFRLDDEVFELLAIVSRQVCAAIAVQQAAETLMQTRALNDYGKRFAFVAHDIKNVSSQLSMLLVNAERHLSNPDFQRDMLVTVRASVSRITGLLRRLQAPETEFTRALVRLDQRLEAIVAGRPQGRRVTIGLTLDNDDITVAMNPASFDAVMTHLLNNAVEATLERCVPGDDPAPVQVVLRRDGHRATIDVIDRGTGMTPTFIRDALFRPFTTSKPLGSGIGAFQARELVREAGGELQVSSTPGAGTTVRILLPPMETLAAQPSKHDLPTHPQPTDR